MLGVSRLVSRSGSQTLMTEHDEYWKKYDWARELADTELRLNPAPDKADDYKQYLPDNPAHPRAWIPPHVRYAKRREVGFRCPVTGWSEGDWYRGAFGNGPYKRIGILTIDHILPGAAGGMTTDENTRAISLLANMKKGAKQISEEDLRRQILQSYKLIEMPIDLLEMLNKYGISQYKVGG